MTARAGRIQAAGGDGGGGGVRAASREQTLQSRGRRVQSARPPPAAAPRHAAPHLAPQRTRIKGAGGGQSPRGVSLVAATELATGLDPGVPDPYHKENAPFFVRA